MTLLSCAPFEWPHVGVGRNSANSLSAATVNAGGEAVAFIFHIPETGTLDSVRLYLNSVTNVNASTEVTVSIFTVSATTGLPTTTLYDAANGEWNKIGSSIISTGWNEFNFTGGDGNGAASVTKGDVVAVNFELTTLGGSDTFTIGCNNNSTTGRLQTPYVTVDAGAGHVKSLTLGPNVALEYASGTYHNAPELGGVNYQVDTTAEEKGNRFKVPFPTRIVGVMLRGWAHASGVTSTQFKLMADATAPTGAALATTAAIDSDQTAEPSSNAYKIVDYLRFDTPVELAKDTYYRLVVDATGTGPNQVQLIAPTAAALVQSIGTTDFTWTEDNGSGGWDNAQTDRFTGIYPIFDQLDDGTGGGSTLAFIPRPQLTPL